MTGNLFDGIFSFDFGDDNTFFGTYVGTVVGLPPPPPPPGTVLTVTFNYTLTGGTGLFTDATGSLLGTGTATFTPSGVNSHIDIAGTVHSGPRTGDYGVDGVRTRGGGRCGLSARRELGPAQLLRATRVDPSRRVADE